MLDVFWNSATLVEQGKVSVLCTSSPTQITKACVTEEVVSTIANNQGNLKPMKVKRDMKKNERKVKTTLRVYDCEILAPISVQRPQESTRFVLPALIQQFELHLLSLGLHYVQIGPHSLVPFVPVLQPAASELHHSAQR